jgi:hypothetical protein
MQQGWSKRMTDSAIFAVLTVVESIQALCLAGWLWHFVPPQSPLAGLFPEYAGLARPEHEGGLYLLFLLVNWAVLCLSPYILEKAWGQAGWREAVRPFVIAEGVITFLLLSALFKTVVYDTHPEFARTCYNLLLVAAFLNKILWTHILGWFKTVKTALSRPENQPVLRKCADVGCGILIVLLLFLPNPEACLGRMFLGEQLHHFDIFIMAPGWAAFSGEVLYKDAISQYGVGAPIVLSHLAQLFGGFTYLNTFLLIMWGCIVYYVLSYVLLRLWFGSIPLAIAGVLVAIRTNMFHPGVLPFVFTYPQATPIRYVWDILFFFCLFFHLRYRRREFLVLAALVCGFSMFYVDSTGVFMTIALYAYLAAHLVLDELRPVIYASKKDLGWLIFYFVLAPAFAIGLFYWAEGAFFFSPQFWHNLEEYVKYFINGAGTIPMYDSLFTQDFLDCLIGYWIPLVYVFTMLFVGTLCYLKKIRPQNIFVVVLCVYGLGIYHYYVSRSSITNFYVVGLPFFWVLCYWINIAWQAVVPAVRRRIGLVMVAAALYALMTNHMFIAYPNLLNWSRNPIIDPRVTQIPTGRISYFSHLFREYPDAFKLPVNSLGETFEGLFTEKDFLSDDEVKAWYRQEFDFPEDAALIDRYVPPSQKAAVISSFEVKMLLQAKRKPFFYYFPLVNSRPLRMRNWVVGFFHSPDYLKNTMKQLEDEKPEYIFIEKIFLSPNIPAAYYYDSAEIMKILIYVYQNYTPMGSGRYLAVMERKSVESQQSPKSEK